ncbi:Os11g0161166 [Oryza sativa Japonica Group]|jgi:hypothetical protein|uniref:Os11g0161166 protein n=1 Tax=Oryza sativa subsp. japonica TaxID=39947 RepID=A0A0N7KSH1_ORYSJ|nr:hypothetical protein EE612_053668 [Oryza sativa]BAT12802.1 Os11g0161166 [Oryza sativa Japonica Group]
MLTEDFDENLIFTRMLAYAYDLISWLRELYAKKMLLQKCSASASFSARFYNKLWLRRKANQNNSTSCAQENTRLCFRQDQTSFDGDL